MFRHCKISSMSDKGVRVIRRNVMMYIVLVYFPQWTLSCVPLLIKIINS